MDSKARHVILGALAGLLGGLAAAFVFWGAWLLPTLGLVLARVSLASGIVVLLILGLLGGGIYALILGTRHLSLSASLLSGLLLGLAQWFLGFFLFLPFVLGQKPLGGGFFAGWTPLLAFILYGFLVSLLYNRWLLMKKKRALQTVMALLVLSILWTPIMLKAAYSTDEKELDLPEGFQGQVIVKGLTYPTSLAISEEGNIYLAEAGLAKGAKGTKARIIMVDEQGGIQDLGGEWNEPINGLTYRDGSLYVSHRGKISEFNLETGKQRDLVTDLPSWGDHQNNDLVFGADGALYFGQGTATNAGVVGPDNFLFGWPSEHPDFHDRPSRDFLLTGENYEGKDLSTIKPNDKKTTGPFAPFGEEKEEGSEVQAKTKANGAVLRYDLLTEELTIYADGLRNPYGLARGEDGQLLATNQGYDERGVRAVKDSPDWLVEVKEGAWYGWPDYAGTEPLSSQQFSSQLGVNRKPLIANQPALEPPLVVFPAHSGPMKLAAAPANSPLEGVYVAIYGDEAPLAGQIEEIRPTGVVKVDLSSGDFDWFIKTKGAPRGKRFSGGFKRIVDLGFSPNGKDMYILDYGVVEYTEASANAVANTGVLWKISPQELAKEHKSPLPPKHTSKEEHHQDKKEVKAKKDFLLVPEKEKQENAVEENKNDLDEKIEKEEDDLGLEENPEQGLESEMEIEDGEDNNQGEASKENNEEKSKQKELETNSMTNEESAENREENNKTSNNDLDNNKADNNKANNNKAENDKEAINQLKS